MSRRRKKRNSRCGSGYDAQNESNGATSTGYQQDSDWDTRGSHHRSRDDWHDDQSMMCATHDDYPDWP